MNIFKIGAVSALVVTAMGVAAGTSYAEPATPDVGYETNLVDNHVVTTLENGTFDIDSAAQTVDVKNVNGDSLVQLGLNYVVDQLQLPIDASLNDAKTELTLTPVTDVARAVPALVHPVASTDENQRAMSAFSSQLGIAMAIGGLVGTSVGAVAGGILGLLGIVGGPLVIPAVLTGITLGAGVGGIIGTITAGGPTLIIAGIDLINTHLAAPGTSKFAKPNG